MVLCHRFLGSGKHRAIGRKANSVHARFFPCSEKLWLHVTFLTPDEWQVSGRGVRKDEPGSKTEDLTGGGESGTGGRHVVHEE